MATMEGILGAVPAESEPTRTTGVPRQLAHLVSEAGFPPHAREIAGTFRHLNGKLDEVLRLLQMDPSLVAMILRRVNSPYYRLDRPVQDLASAAKLLGVRELRNLALAVHLSRMFEIPADVGTFRVANLWNHSIAVAAASHLVSRVCGCGTPSDAFLAGLLHDIGLLVLSRQMRKRFVRVIDRIRPDTPTGDVERQLYGFDHADVGGCAVREWGFPESIIDAVQYHHKSDLYAGAHGDIVFVVAAANYLCSRAGWTAVGIHNLSLPPDVAYRALGVDQVALAVIWEQLLPTLENAAFLATT
jgi:putative nucleotidyltransferase with HDIG domain